MRRKLIQHGKSTLTLSLPREWIKANNLEKGDEINVENLDGNLLVSLEKHRGSKIEISIMGMQSMLRKIIGATFKCGYDEIIIHFNSYDELKAVQDLLREQFSGFEIVSQTKNTLIVKNLSQSDFYGFDEALKRFFFVLNHMADETADALENNDIKWLKTTALLKIETDKFADYCRRAINMGFKSNFKRPAPLYTLIEQMEKVANQYRDICIYCSTSRWKASRNVKEILRELIGFQNLFHGLFYKFDIEKMPEFSRQKENLQKKIDNALSKCSKEEMKVLILIDRIANTIFSLNGPLMAVYL